MKKTRLFMLLGVILLTLTLVGITFAADNQPEKEDPSQGNGVEVGTVPNGWVNNPQPEALWPGPDGYGYSGSSVTFNWVEISATGTPVALSDDDYVGPFSIGFTFPLYGISYTDFYISSNGALGFTDQYIGLSNQCPLPDATEPNNIVPIMWDDLDPGDTGDLVYYQVFSSCPIDTGSCMVVQYQNYHHYPGGGDIAGTFEAILFENGNIQIQFLDAGVEEGSGSTTGIEGNNAPNDFGLTYACNTPGSLSDNTAIRFSFLAGLAITPESVDAQGCGYVPEDHNFSVKNLTGHDTTVNLNYSITNGMGICTGPSSVDIPNGGSTPIMVTFTPLGGIGNLVGCKLYAIDTQAPYSYAASIINKTIVDAKWQQISDEPDNGRMDHVVAGYNGYAWSITGYGLNTNVRRYDPAIDIWTSIAGSTPPFGVNYARSGCVMGNTVYMYGDSATSGFTGLWSYNMDTNVWAQVTPSGTPPAETGIWAPAWVRDSWGGLCFMTGGATTPGTGTLATVYVYNPFANAWLTPLPDFSTVRDFHAAFTFERASDSHHVLCVAGGNGGGVGLTSTQCYDFYTSAWDAENTDMGTLPGDLWGMGYADKFIGVLHQPWVTGGILSGAITNTTWFFDVNTGTWVEGGTLPSGAVYRTSAATVNNEIYKLGGATGGFNYSGLADRNVQLTCPVPPNIEVITPPLHATQPPDNQTTIPMQICNIGGIPLNWLIEEVPILKNLSNKPTVTLPTEAIVNSIQSDRITPFEGIVTQVGEGLQGSAGSSGFGNPEAVLWDNGPLVTHAGGGFGGADASALQSTLGLSTYGFGHQLSANNHVADDFVITDPSGWYIDQITFFAYQTGAPTSPSPLTAVYYQIWDGPPNDPGSRVAFGDLTTNRLISSTWSNIYRALDTNLLDSGRAIFVDVVSAGVTLPIGTYWIEWITDGSVTYSGPWAPPISVLGQTVTGNAMQYLGNSGSWQPALDGAYQQGFPFVVEGTIPQIPWLSEVPNAGTTPAGGCSYVDVNFDSTSLAYGDYLGGIHIKSNDYLEPSINIPVSLTVRNFYIFLSIVSK